LTTRIVAIQQAQQSEKMDPIDQALYGNHPAQDTLDDAFLDNAAIESSALASSIQEFDDPSQDLVKHADVFQQKTFDPLPASFASAHMFSEFHDKLQSQSPQNSETLYQSSIANIPHQSQPTFSELRSSSKLAEQKAKFKPLLKLLKDERNTLENNPGLRDRLANLPIEDLTPLIDMYYLYTKRGDLQRVS
jgi:hypothetical protein